MIRLMREWETARDEYVNGVGIVINGWMLVGFEYIPPSKEKHDGWMLIFVIFNKGFGFWSDKGE